MPTYVFGSNTGNTTGDDNGQMHPNFPNSDGEGDDERALFFDGGSGTYAQGLHRFPVNTISGSETVTSATLTLYRTAGFIGSTATVNAYHILRALVVGEPTYNEYAPFTNWTTAGAWSAGNDYDSSSIGSVTVDDSTVPVVMNVSAAAITYMRANNSWFKLTLSAGDWRYATKYGVDGIRPFLTVNTSSGTQSYPYTATGGFTLSGASSILRKRLGAVSGGITLSGASTQVRKRAKAATGGVTLAGAAAQLRKRVGSVAGGLLLSGAAGYSTSGTAQRVVTATGGLTLSGAATQLRKVTRPVAGGVLLAGAASTATHSSTRTVTATGGLQMGGAAGYATFTAGGSTGGRKHSMAISIRVGI